MYENKIYLKRGVLKSEARERIVAANKNRVWTEEQSKARSERLKGNTHRLGKKYTHTIETRSKIAEKMTKPKPSVVIIEQPIGLDIEKIKELVPVWLRIHPRIFSEVYR
jgi:hypothetical protein